MIAFTLCRTEDPSFRWDGDGPDPSKDGFLAYDVTVKARTIVEGEIMEACEYLGGSYYKHDEPLGDVHGYLPQMLEEAASKLAVLIKSVRPLNQAVKECQAASEFMLSVMANPTTP